jgi:ATP-dependent exoDNAse (exonuclease V) beta subunit
MEGDDVEFSLYSPSSFLPSSDTLPHGKETGLMLHHVFEQIDFTSIGATHSFDDLLSDNSESARIIDSAIHHYYPKNSALQESFRRETARLIWNALRVQLPGLYCRLCDVEKKRHEIEFYVSLGRNHAYHSPHKRTSDDFMHGIIDMIFQYNKRFYIVDWKSNFIEEGYCHSDIVANMKDMGYDLQISIYAYGLIAWLKTIMPEYSYEKHFGGFFYLYLRGIDPEKPDQGIIFVRPDDESSIQKPFTFMHAPQ